MAEKTVKTKPARLAKGWRIHLRRLKQANVGPAAPAPSRPVSDDSKK
jgi:hypothetical protein